MARRAIEVAEASVDKAVGRARFWQIHADHAFNDRRRKVLGKLLEGFEGGMTAKKRVATLGTRRARGAGDDLSEAIRRRHGVIRRQIVIPHLGAVSLIS